MRLLVCFLFVVITVSSAPLEDKVNGLKADSKEVQAFGQLLKDNKEKEEFKKFVEFIKKYDRRYINVSELKKRFKAFQASLVQVEKFQKADKNAVYGVTKFSDFEVSELGEILGFRTTVKGSSVTANISVNGTTTPTTVKPTTKIPVSNNSTKIVKSTPYTGPPTTHIIHANGSTISSTTTASTTTTKGNNKPTTTRFWH
ncbi:unnamed protein product [Bursaphelenchus xylophilus]|uniref:(pine wood nematode) hypothetical protein n=1 Tax=Bursaphelenchus xylophilus TaxID=6326 RepID=A0A1I7RTK4_BURXY|nr:unnamed protein product [Bursaphelenchus xylophilus]CAG9122374.1 unnamed protein product [Bursaphelenchus xylophilus]